ncbi:MAG TPA: ATP-binding protein [Actinomycetota bacterium]|jgi:two-component system sensor histidine kinase KdpD|nr:ATP-binding protein [Actinomycetota bacterium]
MDVPRRLAVGGPRGALGYAVAVGGTALITAPLLAFRGDVSKTTVVLAYLLVVTAAAAAGGLGPGITAAGLGFLAFDLLFLQPYHHIIVDDPQDYLSLAVYLLVAAVVSLLVASSERRRAQAERRERETRMLFDLSTSLVAHGSLDDTLRGVVSTVRSLFDLAGCAIVLPAGDGVRLAAVAGKVPGDLDERFVGAGGGSTAVQLRGPVGADLEPGRALTVPMRSGETVVGALVVVAGGPGSSGFGEPERRVLATFANQAALAVEQVQQEEQRHRAVALQETDRLRTALLNSVSHDLRTPLASIKASASSLLDREIQWSDAERDEFLATINAEVDRLTHLVHNLLDMSRIEAGALDPRLVESSVAEVVGPVVRRARAASRQRVDVDVPDELPAVLVDAVRLDQVLTNLLDNARAYAAGSPVQVVARQAGGTVELRVVDHGPGIPGPERERIFDQFYRLKGGGRRPEGTGMGLAICRGIVEAHGGRLRVETTPGGGATFLLTLPVSPRRAPVEEEPEVARP